PQVTPQVEMALHVLTKPLSRAEFQSKLKLADKKNFVKNYLSPLLKLQLIEMTIPDKPNSRLQKYRLTELGMQVKGKK
ncbi:MAG: hypothetical protein KA146_04940, partial [Leptospiraceae bacterium]|nr:hypothetical protein [Leptospiraceae bacterium]